MRSKPRQIPPLRRLASGVHHYHAARQLRAGRGHLSIPAQRADIVDDLRSRLNRQSCRRRLVCIDREQRLPPCPQYSFDHRQHAPLFLFCAHRLMLSRPRRFAADVEEIRSFIDHPQRLFCRCLRIQKEIAIRERIGSHIQHAHDQRAPAQLKAARAQAPRELIASSKGHRGSMLHSAQG